MAALPYMRLYPADYLADTAHLSAMQHGIYLLLLMNYWQRGGPLPNDDKRLASIARVSMRDWNRNRSEIEQFFTVVESHWHHSRVDEELSRVEAKSLKCKGAAQASVERRLNKRSTSAERPLIYTDTEADTEYSEAKASADVQVIDPETVMWRHGKLYLQAQGISPDKAGALLGKWKKANGAEAVIVALGKAQREGALDPVSFITGCLSSKRGRNDYNPDRITV